MELWFRASAVINRVDTPEGPAEVIGVEDVVIDWLNAVVHWGDTEAREWCVALLAVHPTLDRAYLGKRAREEHIEQEPRPSSRMP